ncbi:N-acetylglucosamine kinase [Xanthovirga aplysinae]|uniref:N-acetylglucosamine kinase n=1 Tax=Xanthovirga aplysinae TaxID=2529853 RepID=UPI0012BC66EC|nr:N-acetylglucosamine kinase [Xanthovirga aplysinae]MTI32437.1 N-acetylglucosamine kinase [Xanthovirga aplysinae]
MILIADSGSTKTDWRTIDQQGRINQAKTVGINPYFQSEEEIREILTRELLPQLEGQPKQTFFYGAGCKQEDKIKKVRDAFKKPFSNTEILIENDLLGVARALCGHEEGIACILGTGSNSCYYDGKEIQKNIPPLGFILGDEGSGTSIGKRFLKSYLREQIPTSLRERFENRFPPASTDFLDKVYQQPFPNRFLASFAKFLFQNLKDPFVYRLVYENFLQFFEEVLMNYPNYSKLKVHFSGSIAFYFANILRQVANEKGIHVRNIVEGPIAGLTLYHQKEINKKN